MPASIQWYCENHVIYARFRGDITIAEVVKAMDTTRTLMESSPTPPVHIVADLTQVRKYPPFGELMRNFKAPPHTGWSVTIGMSGNPILRMFVQAIATSIRMRNKETPNLDDALAFLQKVDDRLPDLHECAGRLEILRGSAR